MGRRAITTTTEMGEAIRAKRIASGLTINQLAKKCGITGGYLSRVETGKIQRPHVGILNSISEALSIPLDELLRGFSTPVQNSLRLELKEIRVELAELRKLLEKK